MKVNHRAICVVAAAFFLSAAGALGTADSPRPDADRKTLEDAGFKCERAGVDSWSCTKEGEKDRICDNAGKCSTLK